MSDTFKVGELLNERSLYSKTYMNFDGSRTVEVHDTMIHFEDTEGNFHNLSTTLYDEAKLHSYHDEVEVTGEKILEQAREQSQADKTNGSLNYEDYDYQGLKVPFLAKLPRIFSRGYSIGDGVETLKFTPVGSSPAKGYVSTTNASELVYQDAWNDADVKLELIESGVKETIILKSDKAPKMYRFAVTEGLSEDLRIGDMQLAPAWLTDANGTYRDVKQELVIDEETWVTFVELTVDTTDLVYPILVDPTVTIKRTADGSNKVDNGISSGAPTTVSVNPVFGTIRYNDNSRFISSYPSLASVIPVGSQVTSATLNLRAINVEDSAVQMGINATAITAPYNPDTVTWNNQPQYSASLVSPTTTYTNNFTWFKINMQSLLQAIADGTPVHGFMFKYVGTGSAGGTGFALSSNSDSSWRPYLTFTYNTPPSKPTVTKPNGGEAWNSSEVITWQSADDTKEVVHEPFPFGNDTTYSSTSYVGQVFTAPADNAVLKKVALRVGTMYPNNEYTMYFARAKANPFGSGYIPDKTQILAQQSVAIPSNVSSWVEMALPNIALSKGTRLAVYITDTAGVGGVTWYPARTNIPQDTNEGNGVVNDNPVQNDFLYRLTYNEGTPTNQLRYQVQLTADNGSTWKNLSALTPAGATSLPYDFINEPASSLCKVRVRAYDGFIYGPWDESDGVFTIVHNIAPNTPTHLVPNGTIEDRWATVRLGWQHNDPNTNDPQAKFDLQWRLQGQSNWITVTQSTTNQFYDLPIRAADSGRIEWRVRTYDQGGLSSAYSIIALFSYVDRSLPPTVIYPTSGAVVPIARPTFTWSHPNQVKFWIQVKTTAGALVYDYSATAANKAITIDKDLSNNTAYTVNIAVMDENGLWSAFTTVPFTVSYTPPSKPFISTTSDNVNGHIKLDVSIPTETGTTPKFSSADVFRKDEKGNWVKLASGLNTTEGYDRPFSFKSDFKSKVSGSTVENPNIFKQGGSPTLVPPSSIGEELTQIYLDKIKILDGTYHTNQRGADTVISTELFSFDIVQLLERNLGAQIWGGKTAIADKVAIAKQIISIMWVDWFGFGTSARGGGAGLTEWYTPTNKWAVEQSPSWGNWIGATTVTKSNKGLSVAYSLDATGFMHILAYAEKAERKNIIPDTSDAAWAGSVGIYTSTSPNSFHTKPTAQYQMKSCFVTVRPSTQYTANADSTHADLAYVMEYRREDDSVITTTAKTRGKFTFTTPADCTKIFFRLSNWTVVEGDFTNLYLVQGTDVTNLGNIVPSTINTDYVEMSISGSQKGAGFSWTDYTPTPNKDETYMVRAYGVNGTYVDSDPIIATVRLQSVQIALASDPTKYVTLKKRDAGKARTGRQASTTTFVGRPYPLTEFGDDFSREYDYRYKIEGYDSVLMIQDFAQRGEAFVLRDNWGKKDYVTFNSVDIEESRYFWYASLQPVKVYYVEGIL